MTKLGAHDEIRWNDGTYISKIAKSIWWPIPIKTRLKLTEEI